MRHPVVRRRGERGSALLIVFLFAAVVAISLYMEMPVAAFEAQRQKEELLVDRGNQYARAVKLFVRKVGHYPSSVKDLEDTNRMRFLRHQYVDPFTGKNDWRLLHAGPGGQLMDSKVNPIQNALGGNAGQAGNAANSASNTASFAGSNSGAGGFGSSSFGGSMGNNQTSGAAGSSNSTGSASSMGSPNSNGFVSSAQQADASPPEVMVQAPRQRGPAIAANGSDGQASASSDNNADAPSSASLPPLGMQPPGSAAQTSGASQNAALALPNGTAGAPDPSATGQPATGQSNGNPSAAGVPNSGGQSGLQASMLGNSGAQTRTGTSASSQMGTLNSSGLAGVASKAGGHSIKTVNDQSDYSLWEFYYDPRKDTTPGGVQMGAYSQQNGTNAGQAAGTPGANSSFGQSAGSGQGSGFGQSGGFGQSSSFGGNSSTSSFGNSSAGTNQNSGGFGSTTSFGNQNNQPANSNGNNTNPSTPPANSSPSTPNN